MIVNYQLTWLGLNRVLERATIIGEQKRRAEAAVCYYTKRVGTKLAGVGG